MGPLGLYSTRVASNKAEMSRINKAETFHGAMQLALLCALFGRERVELHRSHAQPPQLE